MRSMKRRVLALGVLLAVFCTLLSPTQSTIAENQSGSTRYKTVEIQVTQYIWDLVSNRDGQVVCQVIVEHPNRPTIDEAINICAEQIFPPEPTPTPMSTPTPGEGGVLLPSPAPPSEPFNLAEYFQTVTFRFVTTRELVRTIQVPVSEIIVNVIVPPPSAGTLFVSIYAYEPITEEHITEIRGNLNGWEFYCPASRCDVPITTESILEFWAVSSYGDESQHMQATLRLITTAEGQHVELAALAPLVLFQDSCAASWSEPAYQLPDWADFPALPDDLNTRKPYQYLAGKLLYAGIVKAPDCPGGGLLSATAPNSCGMDSAMQAVIDWQNQFDVAIWDAGRQTGIPPLLIKTLIEQESQFWPANARRAQYEYGLGQISQAGADVVMRYDNDLFYSICNGLLYDCSIAYGRLPTWVQATLRGGLMKVMNSECATCAQGIDLNHAKESIPTLARIMRSNCRQVKYIMDTKGLDASYEDMWKLTFVSYHSGYECVSTALDYLNYNDMDPTWANISGFMSCPGASTYANEAWKSIQEFNLYRLQKPERDQIISPAAFAVRPTPTPIPTLAPTPTTVVIRSLAHIRVLVYIDRNGNNYPEESEKVNNIAVQAQFEDGSTLTAQTQTGEAVFDLTGRPVGGNATISLPDLFRSQRVRIVQDGEIPVIFRLEEPVVPPVLP